MKKYLLLIISMLCVSIGTWADAVSFGTGSSYEIDGTSITIHVETAGDYATWITNLSTPTLDDVQACTNVTFTGTLNETDLGLVNKFTANESVTFDFSGSEVASGSSFNTITFNSNSTSYYLIVPSNVNITNGFLSDSYNVMAISTKGTTTSFYLKNNGGLFNSTNLAKIPSGTKTVVVYTSSHGDYNSWTKKAENKRYILQNPDLSGLAKSNFTSASSSLEGIDLSNIASWDETNYKTNFPSDDWKFVVSPIGKVSASGALTADDFKYLKSLNAEYYDFSAANFTFSDLDLGSKVKGITLPKGLTLSDADKAELQNKYGNLRYVFSPTNDDEATVPNRVYVVEAGGLVDAFANEYTLRNAQWIKVGSRVSLSAEDLNFNGMATGVRPTQFAVLDLSNTVIDPSTVSNFHSHEGIFRVILPDNWSADQMTQFHQVATSWGSHLAALYSYAGTTLNILGVNDNIYSDEALKSARIVRTSPATTEVKFVKGTYNNTTQGQFGTHMLAAVNNASASGSAGATIKSVTVASGISIPSTSTFMNTNLETINLSGVTGNAAVTTSACTNLKYLMLNNATLSSVTANNSNLESVGLSKVNIGGNVSLQGAKLTSFTASGTINGDIDLSYNNSLSEINISNVIFSNLGTSTGDLIITRKIGDTPITDATTQAADWAIVYDGGTDNDTNVTYERLTGNIKTSTTFGTGDGNTGIIYPYIVATTKAPYSEDAAGYEKDGCALTITLDRTAENYTTLSDALTYIGTQEGTISNVCNLTINTTGDYELTSADITAINGLTFTTTGETDVTMYRDATLNLDGAKLQGSHLVKSLSSSTIKNVILPRGLDKNVVNATFLAGLTNADFNGAISTNDGHTVLVGYVKKPGQLRTIMSQVPAFRPNVYQYTVTNLRNITLGGTLIAADIATGSVNLAANGNYSEGANSACYTALYNANSLKTLDISNAIFVDATNTSTIKPENMTLSGLGWGGITYLLMPTDTRMNTVPANFLRNCQYIPYLCIPYNYRYIKNEAFYLSGMSHITTTDSQGAEIDNGNDTYTFSKNLLEIGENPGEEGGFPKYPTNPVFGAVNSGQVSDVYILRNGYEDYATLGFSPTKCYRGSFASGMTYGWGGFDGGNLYCREKYKNGAFLFTILHYPDLASLPEGKQTTNTELTGYYDAMEKAYTDVTKQYTKKDQTGALDANGDLLPWPTFSELGRAYNQAIRRLVWADWSGVYGDTPDGNIPGGTINFDPTTHPDEVKDAATQTRFPLEYVGWHEFVLSKATYVAPDETVKNNVIYREYADPQYYTFCVPFDMTPAEVLNLLGVPASTETVKNIVGTFTFDSEGNCTNAGSATTTDLLPKIYTLKSVTRTMKTGEANSVKLTLSKDLSALDGSNYVYFKPDLDHVDYGTYESNGLTYEGGSKTARGADVMIRGGYPYLIKAYLPKGTSIVRGSLGKYVMSRYAFSMDASTAVRQRSGCFIELKGNTYYSSFARPYDQHLVRALFKGATDGSYYEATVDGDGKHGETPYYYRFMGQYWDQYMPTNTYYLYHGNHKWYYNASYTDWDWLPYTCIINACTGSNYLSVEEGSVIPESNIDDTEGHSVFTENLKLLYSTTNALDDEQFPSSSARQYSFVFDDGDIMDIGENSGETTAIDRLNGVDIIPANSKVYNMNGQLVGKSLNGLSKGMYIVNGRKVVVK